MKNIIYDILYSTNWLLNIHGGVLLVKIINKFYKSRMAVSVNIFLIYLNTVRILLNITSKNFFPLFQVRKENTRENRKPGTLRFAFRINNVQVKRIRKVPDSSDVNSCSTASGQNKFTSEMRSVDQYNASLYIKKAAVTRDTQINT